MDTFRVRGATKGYLTVWYDDDHDHTVLLYARVYDTGITRMKLMIEGEICEKIKAHPEWLHATSEAFETRITDLRISGGCTKASLVVELGEGSDHA